MITILFVVYTALFVALAGIPIWVGYDFVGE
jgi:hypothetical protein